MKATTMRQQHRRSASSNWMIGGTLLFIAFAICGGLESLNVRNRSSSTTENKLLVTMGSRDGIITTGSSISVAHIGNSIQYYNDCPRLLEHMLRQKFASVSQDSCLRGGANLVSLLEEGNGMQKKFATPNAAAISNDGTASFDIGAPTVKALLENKQWDFVVMNDHTQAPVRESRKQSSIQALKDTYLPLINSSSSSTSTTTVIFIMTAAYKSAVKDSTDLGTFDDFTKQLGEGYEEYAKIFLPNVKIAPLGFGYQHIRNKYNDRELWEKLYAPDDFHPSPHGTYLEAAILYCTMIGERPPQYDLTWWETSRYMEPIMPLPTEEEAKVLSEVACHICNIPKSSCL